MKLSRTYSRKGISFAKLINRKKIFDCVKINSQYNYWTSKIPFESYLKITFYHSIHHSYEIKINRRLTPKNLRKIRTLNDYLKTVKVQFILLNDVEDNEQNKKIINLIFNGVTINIDVELDCRFLIPTSAIINLLRIEDRRCDEEFSKDFENLIEYFISLGIKGIRSVYKTDLRQKLLNYFEDYEVFQKLQYEGDVYERITIVLDKGLIA